MTISIISILLSVIIILIIIILFTLITIIPTKSNLQLSENNNDDSLDTKSKYVLVDNNQYLYDSYYYEPSYYGWYYPYPWWYSTRGNNTYYRPHRTYSHSSPRRHHSISYGNRRSHH